ncbi:MAG: hypothetical protein RSC80_08355 [Odoribacter sp.]
MTQNRANSSKYTQKTTDSSPVPATSTKENLPSPTAASSGANTAHTSAGHWRDE